METSDRARVTQQQIPTSEVDYPDSDGKPIADNTKQFRWIVVIEQNLDPDRSFCPNTVESGKSLP
jgi:hypothetical protein